MVKRVFSVMYKEVRGLHQAAYVLAVFTLGSQVLALVRDRLLAHQFGAGTDLDVYYAAFRIPDLLYVLFASTLSVYVLIPFVAERLEKNGSEGGKRLLSQILTLFVGVYTVLALGIGLLAPFLVSLLFPGLVAHTATLVLLIRLLLLQPFLLGLSSLLGVITQLGHRFVLYAISPLIYNAGIIAGLLFLYPYFGLKGLVFGVIIGALGHVLIQVPFVSASNLAPWFTTRVAFADVRDVLQISVPRALTLSLHQMVLLGLVGFASTMAVGSVAVFQFAFNLQSVPLAIIGVSYSVAAFPLLAQLYAEGKHEAFSRSIVTALRHIIFWSVPILMLLIVVRAQFVRVILGSGAFNWDDTRLTAAVLALFVASLTAQSIHLIVVRALYAVGNTRLPFYMTLASSTAILVLAVILHAFFTMSPAFRIGLETLMRIADVQGAEVIVLPLAYTIGLIAHSIILLSLARRHLFISLGDLAPHIERAVIAGVAGVIVSYGTLNVLVSGLRTETLVGIFVQGALAGMAGIIAVIVAYRAQGSEELRETYRAFQKRIWKTEVIAPQDEDHLAV